MVMTIEQTVKIPASRKVRLGVSLPKSAPCGRDVLMDPMLEKAIKEAAEKRKAYHANPKQQEEIRALRGSLKNSSIWGGLDGVSYQRKIRDEWENSPVRAGQPKTNEGSLIYGQKAHF
jgi:hypothetical protein